MRKANPVEVGELWACGLRHGKRTYVVMTVLLITLMSIANRDEAKRCRDIAVHALER